MQKNSLFIVSACIFIFLLILSTRNALARYYAFSWIIHSSIRASSPISTISPSPLPTSIPLPSSKPTSTPTVLLAVSPTAISTPHTVSAQAQNSNVSLSSVQKYILDGINNYRKTQGLFEVKADLSTCNFAAVRAQEITSSFTHDGFQNRINSHMLPYSSYHSITENIAMTPDYTQVVPLWIASAGHAENMRADTPYVCVAQSGNYYAYEGWKP